MEPYVFILLLRYGSSPFPARRDLGDIPLVCRSVSIGWPDAHFIHPFSDLVFKMRDTNLNEGWEFRQVGKSRWYPASVPGCVHLDLLANGLIEDPFYRDNERKLQWIGEADWEYRLLFNANTGLLSRKHIEIVFNGLDTYTTIMLNGHEIIHADNMFHPWKADVKAHLKEGQNQLHVYFHSPIQAILPKLKK